jgi:hypothetical protein
MRETDDRDREQRQQQDAEEDRGRQTPTITDLLPVDDLILLAEINELPRHRRRLIKALIEP